MKVEEWCALNGITKSNYYYRLRRVRQSCIETVAVKQNISALDLVELAEPEPSAHLNCDIAARLTIPSGLTLELLNTAIQDAIRNIVKACAYVK